MSEKIININALQQYKDDYKLYCIYVCRERVMADVRDGLKPVVRKILVSASDLKVFDKTVKSARIVGEAMGKYYAHGDCCGPNTGIYCLDGLIYPIEQIYKSGVPSMWVLGVDRNTGNVIPVLAHSFRIGQYAKTIYHIKFSNGYILDCTGNHPIMKYDGTFVQAKDIQPYFIPFRIQLKYSKEGNMDSYKILTSHTNFAIILDDILMKYGYIDYELYLEYCKSNNDEFSIDRSDYHIKFNDYKEEYPFVVDIQVEELDEVIPMYDFTVDGYENMMIPMITNKHCMIKDKKDLNPIPMMAIHNSSIYGTMKPMVNEFEIKEPLLKSQGSWGNKYGDEPAAMRYTEAALNSFCMDAFIKELNSYPNCIDWVPNFDNSILEPESLPASLPILLVNGSFGIGVGLKIEIPKHNLAEVIDETIKVIKDKSAPVKLIPDPCMNCEIIDTDFEDIGNKGYGYFTVRGIMEEGISPIGNPTLIIKSAPDLVYYSSIDSAISKMVINKKLINVVSTNYQGSEFIVELKKGSDLNYVKQMLYQCTDLQKNCRVSFEVLDKDGPIRMSYKAYILFWLEYRKFTKLRIYYAQLQDVNTEMHKLEPYIKLAKSPKMNEIISKIRKSKGDDEYLIEYLIKELDITDLQAKFIINLRLKNLTSSYLNGFIEKYDVLADDKNHILSRISDDSLVEQDIIEELESIKAKYGKKRSCKVISRNEAIGIPQGEFKIVITENNCLKKLAVQDSLGTFKNDKPKYIIKGDNTESILIFNEMGKVFKLPIYKIGFSDKRSNGIDIKLLLKNCTSTINTVMYEPILKSFMEKMSKFFIVTLSASGYIKKMDIDDFLSANASGLMYAKLDDGDYIKDIMIINHKSDVIVYTANKALRFSMEEVPYLRRSTKGNKAIGGEEPILGLSVVLSDTTDIIIVTKKGYINRVPVEGLQRSNRSKSPNKVIKLNKADYIIGLYGLNIEDSIIVTTTEGKIDIKVSDIQIGSTVSNGTKMIKTRGEEILYSYYQKHQ